MASNDFLNGYYGTGYSDSSDNAYGRHLRSEEKRRAREQEEREQRERQRWQEQARERREREQAQKHSAISTTTQANAIRSSPAPDIKPRCTTCLCEIDSNRNYCDKHYKEAINQYERDCQKYLLDKAKWDSLTKAQREKLDEHAEQEQVALNAGLVGLLIGGVASYFISELYSLSGWYYAGLIVFCVIAALVYDPVAWFLGRSLRVVFVSAGLTIPIFLAAIGLDAGLAHLFDVDIIKNWQTAGAIAAAIALPITSFAEVNGDLVAKAQAPSLPDKPQP